MYVFFYILVIQLEESEESKETSEETSEESEGSLLALHAYATLKAFDKATKKWGEATKKFIELVDAVANKKDDVETKTIEFADAFMEALKLELIANLMLLPINLISKSLESLE